MLGFSGARRLRKKAPFSRYPSLHVLRDSGIRISEGSLKVTLCGFSSRVLLEERREHPGSRRLRRELYGECRTEWMNETERLAPLPLAQTLPRRPVGRPQLP
ncbi:hypothetical protein CesoFtcFv8_013717 [Champsocephalus esox]|uniref:Uncharacterized protein n=2 Tax=Champsocephalus TaxID=52236 RepID=A0AAN8DIN5_CHAGU|nr:hypothetical protein CesoFtcFv8_013717 [Champsocephalus esox]KAK5920685.1 hypothetical protein CgunFtcFv8_024470 [Champsocephalus gunnari]